MNTSSGPDAMNGHSNSSSNLRSNGSDLTNLPTPLLDSLREAIWISSPDGRRLQHINAAARDLLGYYQPLPAPEEEAWWRSWVYIDDQPLMETAIGETLSKTDHCVIDVRCNHPDQLHYTLQVKLFRLEGGNLFGLAQHTIRNTDVFKPHDGNLRHLLDSLPLALVVKDMAGRRTFVNDYYLKLHHKTANEVMGKTDFDLFPAEVAEKYTADDRHVIETGAVSQALEEQPRPDGSTRWIERIKSPSRDASGNITGIQLLFWDVTDRKRIEAELDEERYLLHTLLDNLPDSIYFKDRESHFTRISSGMAKKFHLSSVDEAIGKTDADIFTEEHAAAARHDELKVMETGEPIVGHIERETWHDREDTWCSTTKLPLRDSAGNIVGTFGISRDITELKAAQDELRKARDAANAASEAKSEFLANMSHEIRTPMNGILGMSELLSHTELNFRQRDYVELIRQSGDSLMRLLNDILDFSKIEAGRMELEVVPFSLWEMVSKSVQLLGVRADAAQIELAVRIDPQLPETVLGDPTRLRQVIVNLVGNALKFTERGEVVVELCPTDPPKGAARISSDTMVEVTPTRPDVSSPKPSTAEPAGPERLSQDAARPFPWKEDRPVVWIRIAVHDTGIGIHKDKLDSIFEAFTQADTSTTRRFGGTGLGLSISHKLVQLMHGKISVESEPGRGTTFHFTIPLAVAEPAPSPKLSALHQISGLHVLIVDDNATNRRILMELLAHWHLRPVAVEGAMEATAALQEAYEAGDPFHLGLLDMMMPNIDGLMLTESIRERAEFSELPIIMLSSAAQGGDLDRCRQAGIARYLLKPFVHSELLDAILETVDAEPVASPTEAVDQQERIPTMRVLLAEDGIVNQRVAMELLRLRGHQVTLASNGIEALEAWKAGPFDLVLMDLQMPEMDGFQATKMIRQFEANQTIHTPIVAMTARAMKDDRRHCFESGMDGYISKPIDPRELDKTLAKFSPEAEGAGTRRLPEDQATAATAGDAAAATPSLPAPASTPDTQPSSVPDLSLANVQPVLDRFKGNRSAVKQLAKAFFAECPELMQTMRQSIDEDDATTLRRAAHTLKGTADLFAGDPVRQLCAQIESAAGEGEVKRCKPLYESLALASDKMIHSIKQQLS